MNWRQEYRANALLMGGYREDEVVSILMVEFDLDEFEMEDLPKHVSKLNSNWSLE